LNNLFQKFQIRRYTANASLLYILAEEPLPNLIRVELERVTHVQIRGERHNFPLNAAVFHGNESAVQALIMRDDIEANSKDENGWTPLLCAAMKGHEAVVKLLVERDDVEADSRVKHDRTPLSWAVGYGWKAIVELLVERDDVEADSKDNDGRTPLWWAAINKHEAVVKLLETHTKG
jgi:ankyrin repeat protein